jgi:hypothetical protein
MFANASLKGRNCAAVHACSAWCITMDFSGGHLKSPPTTWQMENYQTAAHLRSHILRTTIERCDRTLGTQKIHVLFILIKFPTI